MHFDANRQKGIIPVPERTTIFRDIHVRLRDVIKPVVVPALYFDRRGIAVHVPVATADAVQAQVDLERPQYVVTATSYGLALGYVRGTLQEALDIAWEIAEICGLELDTAPEEYLCNGAYFRSLVSRLYKEGKLYDGPVFWDCRSPRFSGPCPDHE